MGKLKVDRGTTFPITVVYTRNGAAESLAGATVRFTVKDVEYDEDDNDSTAEIQKNITDHTDAAGGISLITIEPEDTADLTPGLYFYDVKVQDSEGDIRKIDEGQLILDGSPTNRLS